MSVAREDSVAYLLHEVNHLMYKHKYKALKKFNITFPQMLVLGFLCEIDSQTINQTMICDKMHLKGSSVTSLLRTMKKNGLVERKDNPFDGRGHIVLLTPKGKEMAEKIKDVFGDIDDKAVSVLTEEEVRTMKELLTKIRTECCEKKREERYFD